MSRLQYTGSNGCTPNTSSKIRDGKLSRNKNGRTGTLKRILTIHQELQFTKKRPMAINFMGYDVSQSKKGRKKSTSLFKQAFNAQFCFAIHHASQFIFDFHDFVVAHTKMCWDIYEEASLTCSNCEVFKPGCKFTNGITNEDLHSFNLWCFMYNKSV